MVAAVRRFLVVVAGILLVGTPAAAQGTTGTLTGRVIDSAGTQPLANVQVTVVGTRLGTLTREDGSYTLVSVPTGSQVVRVLRIGYQAREQQVTVAAGGTTTLNFAINPVATQLNQVVVVGYGQQRREAVTGSVATVDAEQANVGVIANANQLIQGRVAGVNITSNNGEPGGGVQIRVRGGTSLSASSEPLYVIDGVPLQNEETVAGGTGVGGINPGLARNPLNSINPNDIETITVLKDASATAIYGSRGANGVVLITTKRGNGRASTMEYETYVSAATPMNRLDLLNGNEYRAFVSEQAALYTQDSVAGLPASERRGVRPSTLAGLGTANTDWEDEIYRTGYATNHNLTFAGGSPTTTYRASVNYFNQQGVVLSNGLRRYQARLNGQTQAINGKLNLELNLTAARVENDYAPTENGGGFEGGVFTNAVIFNPTRPVRSDDGRYYELAGSNSVRNPVALAEQFIDLAPEDRVLGNLTGRLSILPGLLSAQTTVGVDYTNAVRRIYIPLSNPIGATENGLARQADRSLQNINFQQLLTLTPTIGSEGTSELDIVGGYEFSEFENSGFGVRVQGYSTDQFTYNALAGGGYGRVFPESFANESRLVSFFSRANYGFRDRYFVTGVIRYDGSSRLAEGNQWQTFPAVGLKWVASEENFFQNSRPLGLSTLAVRAGYGKQGNQSVQPNQTRLLFRANEGARYPFGGNVVTGLTATQVANENLKWETSTQTNLGFDFGFSDNRFTGVLDLYTKTTDDLLLDIAVPQPAVVSTRIENVGSIRNRGVELSLDGNVYETNTRAFSAGLVVTVERNEVTDLGGRTFIPTANVFGQGQSGVNSQRIIVGEPVGTFYGWQYAGVSEAGVQQFSCVAAEGRADCVNGVTTNPRGDDQRIIGNANPDFTLGLRSNGRWNRFDASWLWRAEIGRDVFNNTALVYSTKSNVTQDRNFLADALGDPIALGQPAIYSSRWIENGSFLRLQNITVGYNLALPTRLGGRDVRVYLSGDNVLLFSDYSGLDPEVFVRAGDGLTGVAARGIDYLVYPRARTFTFGTRLSF